MIEDCSAIILAGGESKRMGRDKAVLLLHGETLLQRVTASVQPMFAQTMLSVRQPRADIKLPQICDVQQEDYVGASPARELESRAGLAGSGKSGGGPLVGLVSALEKVTTPWAFVVACDMPFIAPDLIRQLASLRAGHQAVVPRVDGYAQPLAAFYARSAVPLLQSSLAAGNQSLIAALKTLDVRYVEADELLAFDPQLRSFFDLDTPQDVVLAEGMK